MFVDNASPAYDYTFSYDAMGRFEKILVPASANPWFQYYYDDASNEKQRNNLFNRVSQIYPRDALNRMQYVELKNDASPLAPRRLRLRWPIEPAAHQSPGKITSRTGLLLHRWRTQCGYIRRSHLPPLPRRRHRPHRHRDKWSRPRLVPTAQTMSLALTPTTSMS